MRQVLGWTAIFLFACDDGGSTTRPMSDAAPPLDRGMDAAPASDAAVADAARVDLGVDAHIPLVADEPVTEGLATRVGADDLTAAVPMGVARAGQVNAPSEALTGVDARCRPGCYRLDNALIKVCIQGASTFSQITFQGGNLIDACPATGPCSDRLREINVTPGLGEVSVESIGIVRDGTEGGAAIVRTVGRAGGGRTIQAYVPNGALPQPVKVTTEYRLYPDQPYVEMLTWMAADQGGAGFLLTDMVLYGDRTLPFFPEGPLGAAPNGRVPYLAATGEEVAYRFDQPSGPVSVINIPVDSFPLRPVTYGQLAIQQGDEILLRRRFWVGTDIEAVREAPEGALATVLTGPPGAWVEVDDGERQVTRAHLGADGHRTIQLAPGSYRALATDWPGGEPSPTAFVAGDAVQLTWPAPARLRVQVRDDQGRSIGAKVLLSSGGEERPEFVLGETELLLPPGEWHVVTTRGWHYTVDDQVFHLVEGAESALDVRLTEVIPFDGWSAGEFHQHSTSSLDSEVPNRTRILSNIAEGVGFMVPSDHDVIFDFQGLARQMGVLDRIGLPLVGAEVSPLFGHLGAYGLRYDPEAGAGGAPPLPVREGERWRVSTTPELVAASRERGAQFIQMNHPREGSAWLDAVDFNVEVPVEALDSPNWTPDFESMEIYNRENEFCRVLSDWFGLLNQGLHITAVGNSDTHGEGRAPGYPRNYVRTAAATAAEVSSAEIITAMREGRSIMGAGAVMDFPFGPLPGDTVAAPDGMLRLHVRLRTPPYTSINRLLAFHNGRAVYDQPVDSPDAQIVDHDAEIAIPVDTDGPVVVLALGNPRLPYVASGPVFALANPVWVDRDGDGQITPAGPGPITLPDMEICP